MDLIVNNNIFSDINWVWDSNYKDQAPNTMQIKSPCYDQIRTPLKLKLTFPKSNG